MANYALEIIIWMTIATGLGVLIGWLTWGRELKKIIYKYSNLFNRAQLEKRQSIKTIGRLTEELELSKRKLMALKANSNSEVENLYINQLEKDLEDERLKSREFKSEVDQLKSQIDLR